jgi:hypothetical protein
LGGQVGAHTGALFHHEKYLLNSAPILLFIQGLNGVNLVIQKEIRPSKIDNAETRIKSIITTKAVASADTVYQAVAGAYS